MTTLDAEAKDRILTVSFDGERMSAQLADGRVISVPLAWYPRLANATAEQRRNWRVSGGGAGVHWPDVDEDLSAAGLLRGAPAAVGKHERRRRGTD